MAQRTKAEYLTLGQQILPLLGSALAGPSAKALGKLARDQHISVDEARINAEVFLFHKYLLMQACVGVFPEPYVDQIVGGLFAALNERANGLEFSSERQQAMEDLWRLRAEQFDHFFMQDQQALLDERAQPIYWKEMISQFCRNVRDNVEQPDMWAGSDRPSHLASQSVTTVLAEMMATLEEINHEHFSGAV